MNCLACQEDEHDCCINLLRPLECPCGCSAYSDSDQPPAQVMPLFVFLNYNDPRPLPRMRSVTCPKGHKLEGGNVYRYQEGGREKVRCLTCRRHSWRTHHNKKRNRNKEAS